VNSLYRYAVYGLIVGSEESMISMDVADGAEGDPDITITFTSTSYFRPLATGIPVDEWVTHATLDDGSVYLKADKIFESIVSRDGRSVICARLESIDRRTFEANLMNFVLGTALTLQGEEPLHATVVDLGGRAVGLFGPSGAGKSSLAAFLISRGADLVTDDMLRLEFVDGRVQAYPGPYRLKLLDEAGRRYMPTAMADGHFNAVSEKVMVRPRPSGRARAGAVSLAALFYLGPLEGETEPDVASTRRLEGLELGKVIISSAMDFRYNSIDRLTRQMTFAARLSHSLPIHALRYPRSFDVMGQVEAEILRTIGA